MIQGWSERDVTIPAGGSIAWNVKNPGTNMIQILNRGAGSGAVYGDTRQDVSANTYAVKVEGGNTGAIVRPYVIPTLYLVTDSATPVRLTIIEINTTDINVVFNASQSMQLQGGISLSGGVEISNDAGNPIPVSAPAGQSLPVQEVWTYRHLSATGTTTIKTGAGSLARITIGKKGDSTATVTVYDSTSGSGAVLAVLDASVAMTLDFHAALLNGLTIVIAGTTAPDVTVTYK